MSDKTKNAIAEREAKRTEAREKAAAKAAKPAAKPKVAEPESAVETVTSS